MSKVIGDKKTCARCKEAKPLSEFYKNPNGRQQVSSYCRPCENERKTEYARKNRIKLAEYRRANKERFSENRKRKYYSQLEDEHEKLKRNYRRNIETVLLNSARNRARKKGVPFDLQKEDVIVPAICPVLGIKIEVGNGNSHANSPSIDRIVPEKGYVRGNVIVVSHRANTIKNDASIEELEKVENFYSRLIMGVSV